MQTVTAFFRDERGSYTIEFCLWIPVFFFFLAATVDASMIYLTHSTMWNAVRDAARGVTTGQFASLEEAHEHVAANFLIGGTSYWFPQDENVITSNEVTITIRTNIYDASAFGIFSVVGDSLGAAVTMRLEPALI